MARVLILAMVAVLLFGGVLATDQALQNEDVAVDTNNTTQQDNFAEATTPIIEAGVPVALFALVVGTILAAVRAVG